MANILESIAWNSLKPKLKNWLNSRALVLPATTKVDLAKECETTVAVISKVNAAIIAKADADIDGFRP